MKISLETATPTRLNRSLNLGLSSSDSQLHGEPMPRTNYIFVDYENVQENELDRIAHKPVKLTLVLGRRHKTLPVKLVRLIHKCAPQVVLLETALEGKNALDFVLACQVGSESLRDPQGYFHIVSGDTGFDALIAHLKGQGMLAARHKAFREIPVLMNADERARLLANFFKTNSSPRPKRRVALEAQIQGIFGKALSAEDVAATVQKLVQLSILIISDKGAVSYGRENSSALTRGEGSI